GVETEPNPAESLLPFCETKLTAPHDRSCLLTDSYRRYTRLSYGARTIPRPMAINVRLSSELKDWITHNLNRGCAPAALVESMVGQNFDRPVARGLVDAFVTARAAGMPAPEGAVSLEGAAPEYRYETP